jgi:GNAT superfamily N-acetyltransferase
LGSDSLAGARFHVAPGSTGGSVGEFAIRKARSEDREALCRLYHEFHQFHAARVPDRLVDLGPLASRGPETELSEILERLIERDDALLLVAETQGAPIGMAEAYVREDEPSAFRQGRRYAVLQSLFVQEDRRRRGIGRSLLAAIEGWAAAHAAREVRIEVWEFTGDPVEFYEGKGYRTLRRTMVRSL